MADEENKTLNQEDENLDYSLQMPEENTLDYDCPKELDDCKQENQKLQEQLEEAKDKYLRTHADFDNIKKRLEREKFQAIEYASEKFAKDLLSSIDTLEMALNSFDNKEIDKEQLLHKVKEGIEHTKNNLLKTFEKYGIEVVETESFDPNFHDAVMSENSEHHEDGEIIEVLQKGYKYKERLLRPAMVKICKK
jgi:molecular chaperone GrpE